MLRPVIAEPRHFQVAEGPACDRLLDWSIQAGLGILCNLDQSESRRTRAVAGDLEPREALKKMLQGSGLQFQFTRPNIVSIKAAREPEAGPGSNAVKELEFGPEISVPLTQIDVFGAAYHGEIEPPIGVNPLRITAAEIQATGVATPQGLLQTLPQVFRGGATENTHNFGREARTNAAIGSGVNLRGLGSGATLILVNGRPLAPSGTAGTFTDISNIPLTAIDHVDIMADGASVLYGGSAIGGIVNFVLRDDVGLELASRVGGLTSGSLGEQQLSASYARDWKSGHVFFSYEYYERDPLWASDRARATSDLRPFGGDNFDAMAGNPGTIFAGGTTYAVPSGQNGRGLTPAAFAPGTQNYYDLYRDTTILHREGLQSAVLSGTQALNEHWNLFADALTSWRHVQATGAAETASFIVPAANAFYVNPAADGGPVEMMYGFGSDFGPLKLRTDVDSGQLTAGANYTGHGTWHAQVYAGYSFENERQLQENRVNYSALDTALGDNHASTAFNPFGDGSETNPATLALIRSEGRFRLRSNVAFANVTAEGTVLSLPSGDLTLTIGTDFRTQAFDTENVVPGQPMTLTDNLGRRVFAALEQVRVPLIGANRSFAGLKKLDLSAGLRYEHYSDVGQVVTPQFGFSASPSKSLTLRGTWARLSKAPDLADLSESTNISAIEPIADSASPLGRSNVLVLAGNNAGLKPETAKSWTLGFNFTPVSHPEASLALTYFHTDFTDLVGDAPNLSPTALTDPSFNWLITRNVSAQERANICQHGQFLGLPSDCLTVPVVALIDLRLHNLVTIKTRGFDLISRYAIEEKSSRLTFGVLGTKLLEYAEATTVTGPLTDMLNTQHNPIDLRLRGSMTWERGGLTVAEFVNYQDAYRDTDSQPNRRVSSWTTADMTVTYAVPNSVSTALAGTKLSLNMLNVFNASPPFLNNEYEKIGYDQENGDLAGRMVSVTVRKRW